MSDVAGVGSTASTTSSTTGTTGGMSSLDGEDFMKILIAQLQQQDPMNPMSNEAMVTQMSAIRDMEMNYTLTQALQQMTNEQRFAGAAGLIGKYVSGVVEDGDGDETTLEGVVTGVRFTEKGKAILELDTGAQLPLEKMTAVQAEIPVDGDETEASLASKLIQQARSKSGTSNANPLGSLASFGLQNTNGLNLGVTLG
ncbi:MAG: hypothetical protein JXQ73_24950 [Phycisphaerae bacterium]|nr:hypothetical protein [Phycisphaerae bacterium]